MLVICLGVSFVITKIGSTQSMWLVILWASWIASVGWAFTRPSFSIPFAIILAGMLIYVIIPATIHIVSGRTVLGGDDFGAGTTTAVELSALAQWGRPESEAIDFEFASIARVAAEAAEGAGRFAAGAGRHGASAN